MAKELDYPQVTDEQIDLWMSNPVTVALLRCFEFKRLDQRDAAGGGDLIDSSSADLTHALLHRSLGQQDAYLSASKPREILGHYNLILIPEPEPEEKEADANT